MTAAIKRPIRAYLFQILWIAVVLYWSTTNSSTIGQWILRTGAIAGMVSFVHMVIKRNYFEVADDILIINESILKTTRIDLAKIEKIVIEPGPFTPSRIVLKDNTKVKYSNSQIGDKKLKEFMGQFNIPVE